MRILLATDGSPQARGAEVLAEWLCYKLSAKLVALYVRDSRLIRVLELTQNLHLCTLGIVMLGGPLERGRRFPV